MITTEIPELQMADVVAGLSADDFLFIESGQAIGLLSSIAATPIGGDPLFLDSWNRLEEDRRINTWPTVAGIANVDTRPMPRGPVSTRS